jgi:hypothetical protein
MIEIDFQGGMHGNYLEYICNRFLAGIDIQESLPFNKLGASHQKTYVQPPFFKCGHFSTDSRSLTSTKVVAIKLTPEDLLPAQCVSLLRAGEYDIDPNLLEKDTYNKLNNHDYQWVLHNLIEHYFQAQVLESYCAVMDPSWPMIHTKSQFQDLPDWIRHECLDQHGLCLYDFSESSPDCPRYILREFFKIGFNDPDAHGFMTQQKKFRYEDSVDVYEFPFRCFYDTEKFQQQILDLGTWSGLPAVMGRDFDRIHQEFLSRQVFKDSKKRCDDLVSFIATGEDFLLPGLNVIEEAYVDSCLEKMYNLSVPLNVNHWFDSANIIKEMIRHAR